MVGAAWLVTSPAALAKPNLKVHSTVNQTGVKVVGQGAGFGVKGCSSTNTAEVKCEVWSAKQPNDSVRYYCLALTPTPVTLTITYLGEPPQPALPPTTITATCKAAKVVNVSVPGRTQGKAIAGASGAPFNVTSCTVTVPGARCTFSGEKIEKWCPLDVTVNVLPVTVNATVTIKGDAAINGSTLTIPFVCL